MLNKLEENDIINYKKELDNKLNIKIKEYINNKIYDIYKYEKIYEDMDDEWYRKFIFIRIIEKKNEGFNPKLTDKDILYLQNEENFINYFKEFLKLKIKTDYYVYIENEIVNSSREKTINESLGLPTLDNNIRKKNYKYVMILGKNCDNMYKLIEEYLNLIENINDEFSFSNFLEMKTY